jgi:hypothetical protein
VLFMERSVVRHVCLHMMICLKLLQPMGNKIMSTTLGLNDLSVVLVSTKIRA